MYTILITGANGLIGSQTVEFFKRQGMNIITAGRTKNDIYMDFNKPRDISKIVVEYEIDICIHLAAANEIECIINPIESANINIIGTKAILDFCVLNKISYFVYISTMHVYGNLTGNINENTVPIPKNDYGLTHYLAEKYIEMYANKGLIKYNILRPTNLYDTPLDIQNHKRWTLVPYDFCKSAIDRNKIEIKTNGTQKRNFLSIEDLNKLLLNLILKKSYNNLIHVIGNDDLEIKELAALINREIKETLGNEIEINVNKEDKTKYEEFNFSSLYLKDIYLPEKTITKFISEFVDKYYEFKMENQYD